MAALVNYKIQANQRIIFIFQEFLHIFNGKYIHLFLAFKAQIFHLLYILNTKEAD